MSITTIRFKVKLNFFVENVQFIKYIRSQPLKLILTIDYEFLWSFGYFSFIALTCLLTFFWFRLAFDLVMKYRKKELFYKVNGKDETQSLTITDFSRYMSPNEKISYVYIVTDSGPILHNEIITRLVTSTKDYQYT